MRKRVLKTWLGVLLAASLAGPLLAATAGSASGVQYVTTTTKAGGSTTTVAPTTTTKAPTTTTQAPTTTTDPWNGAIEVCKTSVSGTLAVTGPFTFNVTGGTLQQGEAGVSGNSVVVSVGSCSDPIPVAASGNVTITEASQTWYQVEGINAVFGGGYLVSSSNSGQDAVVSVSPSTVSAVNFTNEIVPGYVEVCKNAAAGSGLSGTFTFTVNSTIPAANRFTGDPWTQTASANVGACSQPIEMPAYPVTVTENGSNLYITAITSLYASNTNAITAGPNYVAGTVSVGVKAAPSVGDFSQQTDVWYTNNIVAFKICKNWDPSGTDPVSSYPFSYTAAGTTTNVNVTPGSCSNFVSYPAGTSVAITEGIVPGTKVESISAPALLSTTTVNALSVSTPAVDSSRTITVVLGTPVNEMGITNPGNEAVVTYLDEIAAPGELKLCKYSASVLPVTPTPLAPIGTTFSFTLSGAVTGTVSIPLGDCYIVLNSAGTAPLQIPFNSTVHIAEAPSTGNAVYAITVIPTDVYVNGSYSTEPVISTAPSLSAGTVSVQIGESNETEVDYYNTDPPIVTPGSGNSGTTSGQVTVNNPGAQGGTTTSVTAAGATSIASGFATISAAAPVVGSSNVTVVKVLTKAQKKALLSKDEKTLANVEKTIAKDQKIYAHSTGKQHVAEGKVLASLRSEVRVLNREIKSLK
jgi:hypothetical protein